MFSLRYRIVRQALAMLLLALCAVVSIQRAQVVVNDVQHGLAIDHLAPAFELASTAHDHPDDHHPAPAEPAGGESDDNGTPGAHHHHVEGPQAASLPAPVLERVILGRTKAPAIVSDRDAPRLLIFGLERPPKALGEHRA